MKDKNRTKSQLLTDMAELRQRIVELKGLQMRNEQLEKKLRESEERQRILVENSFQAIMLAKGPVPEIIFANSHLCKILGYTFKELISLSPIEIGDLLHPEDRDLVLKSFKDRLAGKSVLPDYEFRMVRKDAEIIWVHMSASTIEYEEQRAIHASFIDITKQKQAEKTLQRERDRAQKYLDIAGVMLVVIDTNQKVSLINKKGCEILGYTEDEIIGQDWFDNFIPKRIRKDVKAVSKKLLAGEFEPAEYYENPILTRSGDERLIAWHNTVLRNEKGKIVAHLSSGEDITERMHKEEALKDSEERLRILFEYAPDAYYLNDLKGNFIDGNKAAEKLTGYKRKELIGKNFLKLKLLPPDQMPKAAAFLAKNLMGKATGPDEFVLTRKDGTRVYADISTNPVKVKGRTVVLGIARDISKIKQAENKLKLERVYIDQLFESAQEAIVIADKNGLVMRGNDEFIRLFGFSSHDEIVGTSVDNLVAPDDAREIAKSITNKVRMGDSVSLETVRQKKDGSLIDVSILASPIAVDGKLLGIFGIYRDISDRKQAEEALRESEAKYRVLFETSADGILIADIETRQFKYANPALCKMFGYSEKEFMKLGVKDIHPQEDLEYVISEFAAQAKGEKTLAQDIPCLRKDGIIMYTDINTTMYMIDGKKCNIGFFRDITERKQADEQLMASFKEKEVLLREIHHRVKNNLQVIISLLLLQSKQISGKKNLELFHESQNRVKSMALIHEKLYQSQDLASVNFKEYLNTLIIGLFRSYQSHSSNVELKLSIDDISLGIDSAIPCGLIINELVSNSLKYAFPNGREGVISVAFRSLNKKDVELVVSDNGIGMPEDLDFRNTKSLGLHLVTILAEDQLEGGIKLSRDKGTEFRIKLRGVK